MTCLPPIWTPWRRARAAGVTGALCILSADEPAELGRVTTVRAAWPGVQFSAAVHPHRAVEYAGRPEEAARLTAAAVDASVPV